MDSSIRSISARWSASATCSEFATDRGQKCCNTPDARFTASAEGATAGAVLTFAAEAQDEHNSILGLRQSENQRCRPMSFNTVRC